MEVHLYAADGSYLGLFAVESVLRPPPRLVARVTGIRAHHGGQPQWHFYIPRGDDSSSYDEVTAIVARPVHETEPRVVDVLEGVDSDSPNVSDFNE